MSIIQSRSGAGGISGPGAEGGGSGGAGIGLALLRAIIDAGGRSELRQLTPALFVEDELGAYEFVFRFYRTHGALPSTSAMLEGGFILPPVNNPISYYMERCATRATYNSIVQYQEPLAGAMRARNMDDAVAALRSMIRSVDSARTNQEVQSLAHLGAEVMADYEIAHANPGMQGVTLGWGYLDDLTGGAEDGDVVTFVARPGMGKSWLLTHIARNAWLAGHSVLFVSMEMTGKQITRRFLGMQAGINPNFIRSGQLSHWTRDIVYEQLHTLAGGPPFHMLSGSFDKSVPLVDAAIQEFSPSIVFIDASYLMAPAEKGTNQKSFELLSNVGKEIKQMAMARNKPIVQTVQFNREKQKAKTPDVSQIGGTDAVGQITTIAVAIEAGAAPYERIKRKLTIMKNREGEDKHDFDVNFRFAPPNFDYLPRLSGDGEGEGLQAPPIDAENLDEWAP
jgi:replicative DNA helicase